ncbi:MAG TPA: TonB-dependent receptor plug domain-containing protein, partial [Bacteroidales bacterium]|nr:TonB-dependent receptor plug domain-containing protein [Bacteroidales bacterium]
MMKYIISILLSFSFINSFGQQLLVVDENNNEPIENVAVYNLQRNRAAITDSLGVASPVIFMTSDTLVFQHPSYKVRIISYSSIADNPIVALSKKNILMDEYIISASKSRESKQVLPYTVSILQRQELRTDLGQTSAEILLNTGNILIQKSQAGGGSPILRGFEANKILLVVDGVRMNNAIYRSGHLQNSITIDHAALERTEVVFGPSSLIYGSDALGGVIHYYTKDPSLSTNKKVTFSGSAYTQYSTANRGKVGHLDFNLGNRNIASFTSVSYKDLENIRIGSKRNRFFGNWGKILHYVEPVNGVDSMFVNQDENIQHNTDYSQIDILQKFKYSPSDFIDWLLNIQYSTSSNIDRLDKLNDYSNGVLKYADYYYGPQDRLLVSVKNVNKNDNPLFTNATSIFAYQNINEDRITRKFRSPEKLFQLEKVNVLSL